MIPRQFKLTNSRGETLDLLNQNGAMFFMPGGLGYTEEADWLKLGTTFRPVNISSGQRVISGTMFFLGEQKAYDDYFSFVRFIRLAPLTIEYTSHDTFNIDVRVQSIDKSELTAYGTLECKIEFVALGPFYKLSTIYVAPPKKYGETIVDHSDNPIVDDQSFPFITGAPMSQSYEYTYDDVYPEELSAKDVFDLDYVDDAPLKISILGPCTNPQWLHYVNDEFVASGKYNGYIADGRKLVIDATNVPYRIYEADLNGNYFGDRYGGCDFSTERFLFAKYGRNRISVAHEDLEDVGYTIEVKQCYESV